MTVAVDVLHESEPQCGSTTVSDTPLSSESFRGYRSGFQAAVTRLYDCVMRAWNGQRGEHCTYKYVCGQLPTEVCASVIVRLPGREQLYVKDSKFRSNRTVAQNIVASQALERLCRLYPEEFPFEECQFTRMHPSSFSRRQYMSPSNLTMHSRIPVMHPGWCAPPPPPPMPPTILMPHLFDESSSTTSLPSSATLEVQKSNSTLSSESTCAVHVNSSNSSGSVESSSLPSLEDQKFINSCSSVPPEIALPIDDYENSCCGGYYFSPHFQQQQCIPEYYQFPHQSPPPPPFFHFAGYPPQTPPHMMNHPHHPQYPFSDIMVHQDGHYQLMTPPPPPPSSSYPPAMNFNYPQEIQYFFDPSTGACVPPHHFTSQHVPYDMMMQPEDLQPPPLPEGWNCYYYPPPVMGQELHQQPFLDHQQEQQLTTDVKSEGKKELQQTTNNTTSEEEGSSLVDSQE